MTTRILSGFVLATMALTFSGCGADPAANVTPAVTAPPKPETSTATAGDAAKKPTDAAAAPISIAGKTSGGTASFTPAASPTTPTAPAVAATTASARTLPISSEASKIEFIGGKKVGGAHNGGFKTWNGTVELVPGKDEVAKISVDIDTASLYSDDEKLTVHLKNKDFFEVDKYPKATFVTTELKPGGDKGATHTLVGNLTLHGETKSITIPATVKVADGVVSIASEFSLKRSEFGMNFTGPGGVIRDDVVIKLDVKSVPKKA